MSATKENTQNQPPKEELIAFERAFKEYAQKLHAEVVALSKSGSKKVEGWNGLSDYGGRFTDSEKERTKLHRAIADLNIHPLVAVEIIGKIAAHTLDTKTVATPQDIKDIHARGIDLQQMIDEIRQGKPLKNNSTDV